MKSFIRVFLICTMLFIIFEINQFSSNLFTKATNFEDIDADSLVSKMNHYE
ncbi:hypothetical protein [Metabacillus fastidiosus]|uniref:hypothetical protein n=1 Tax=Metabacillus fastidiosus TaxID=1458 RepID=UPI000AA8A40A|nr:hypothetical protein [Metabacillus fastidiosus]MED4462670.1 hypothetical protein [Metabacillus fastidiosus]